MTSLVSREARMAGAASAAAMEEEEEEEEAWLMDSLRLYNDLHLFELPGPTRVIEWIGDQHCSQNTIRAYVQREISRLKGVESLIAPSTGSNMSWEPVGHRTVDYRFGAWNQMKQTEDTSWSKIATSCAKPACVLHGQRISNLQMTEIESEKSLWVAGSANLDKIASLGFLDEATAVVCGAKGQLFLVDFRQQQGILGELEEARTPWAQTEGLNWCAGVGSGEAPLIARLSSGGLVVLTDIRHPSSPLKMAQCCAPTSNLLGTDFQSISLAPVPGDNLAVSGQEAKPVFIHKGHIFGTPDKDGGSPVVTTHTWHPWKPQTLLSAASDGSLHVWDWSDPRTSEPNPFLCPVPGHPHQPGFHKFMHQDARRHLVLLVQPHKRGLLHAEVLLVLQLFDALPQARLGFLHAVVVLRLDQFVLQLLQVFHGGFKVIYCLPKTLMLLFDVFLLLEKLLVLRVQGGYVLSQFLYLETEILIALLLFYALTLAIGIWASRKTRQKEHQKPSEVAMVGGRNMNFCIGLFTATGGFFFVNPMRMRNYMTLMDPIQEMYGNVMSCLLFIPPLIADIFWFAAVLASLGATMKVILDIQGYVAIILSACPVVLYTLLGGLYSVAYTDVIQLIFISLSLWICIPFAIMNPATENIFHTATHNISQALWTGKIEPEFYGRWFDDFLYLFKILLFFQVLGAIPWQTYFQRVLAASSHKEARLISYFSGLGCIIMAIPSVLIGAVAASTDWNQTDYGLPTPYERNESALILPLVLQHLCPMYISVGGLGAIAAAVMSSGDSALLSAGSMFAHNIYRKIFRRKATEKEVLWAMRISMVVFGIISALLAFYSSSIYDLWFLSGELVYTLLFPQLCCALFLPSTNTYGSIVGFFLGFLLRLLAGEPSLKIPPVICYPGCSVVEGIYVQLFPFKMVTMLVTLLTIFSTSHLASFMFRSGILPAEWDICQVIMDARVPVPFSWGERQMDVRKIQNCEQAEEAVHQHSLYLFAVSSNLIRVPFQAYLSLFHSAIKQFKLEQLVSFIIPGPLLRIPWTHHAFLSDQWDTAKNSIQSVTCPLHRILYLLLICLLSIKIQAIGLRGSCIHSKHHALC
ncbi:hypothetical protein E2320_005538 [Naja naja]|nr:hypothetical protein E2320_005538 [Naja naja]